MTPDNRNFDRVVTPELGPYNADLQYQALLQNILDNGQTVDKERTGTGTTKVFARHLTFDLKEGFPLLTTKKVNPDVVFKELIWFISGDRNIRPLLLDGVNIWKEWPYKKYLLANGAEDSEIDTSSTEWKSGIKSFITKIKENEDFANDWGDLGPVYGYQWRHWNSPDGSVVDQLGNVIEKIKGDPYDRRLIVTSWHPGETDPDKVALPPCHLLYQFNVNPDGTLDCQWYQRSVDTFLGLPFNIASYALLTHIVAQSTGYKPGKLSFVGGDTHLYSNHHEQVQTQLERSPFNPPDLKLDPDITDIDKFTIDHIEVVNYKHHDFIPAPISV
jgi:thymidylate synthase